MGTHTKRKIRGGVAEISKNQRCRKQKMKQHNIFFKFN